MLNMIFIEKLSILKFFKDLIHCIHEYTDVVLKTDIIENYSFESANH